MSGVLDAIQHRRWLFDHPDHFSVIATDPHTRSRELEAEAASHRPRREPCPVASAARRRSLSPFQEVPVRALHVPRSVRAVAASPSALGEIPMPRAFRFAASGRFPWSVERSRVVARSSVHTFMESTFTTFWYFSLPCRGRRRPVSPWI